MEELIVHAYDWNLEDKQTDNDGLSIHAWCLDKNSKPYLLRFEDFPAICYIELPLFCQGCYIQWDKNRAIEIYNYLVLKLGDNAPNNFDFFYKHKLYYYKNGKKYPMIRLNFKSIDNMRKCQYLVSKPLSINPYGTINFKMWEFDISTILKMLCFRKCNYSQWFKVKGELVPPEEKLSTLDNEYICEWKKIIPISPDETKNWMTYPRIISFDIEVYSDNHNAMPNKYISKHIVNMITITFGQLKNPTSIKKFLIKIGESPPIENCEIIIVNDEISLIREFEKKIIELDPEIIIGYNIFGFDYPYLDFRLKRINENWGNITRLKNKNANIKTDSWKSRAVSFVDQAILIMPGRISIDMLPLIKKDYKLSKYDLDSVSRHFINKGKHSVKAKEMFTIHEQCMSLSTLRENPNNNPKDIQDILNNIEKFGRYAVEDSILPFELFDELYVWIGIIELSNSVMVPIFDTYTRGQQLRCISQLYKLCSESDIIIDERKSEGKGFKGGYVADPIPGLYDYAICLDFKSLYPSIIEAFNICYTTLIPNYLDISISRDLTHNIECVEEIIDNKSEDSDEDNNNDIDNKPKRKKKTKKSTITIKHLDRFIKSPQGIIPKIVHKLVSDRNIVRKQINAIEKEEEILKKTIAKEKGITDEIQIKKIVITDNDIVKTVLDKRQLALKISANSMFGFLGVSDGKLPLPEGARSITSKGRQLIQFCNDYLVEKYKAKVVYNDTDSTMFVLPFINNNKDCLEWGFKLEKEISSLFPDPLNVDFEKAGRILLLKKKKYAFWPIDFKTNELKYNRFGKPDIMYRGIVLARRDNCQWQRKIYTQVLENIMTGKSMIDTLNYLTEEVFFLMRGYDPNNYFNNSILDVNNNNSTYIKKNMIIVRELGSNYKSENFFMKVFSDDLRKIGHPQTSGNRLEYFIVKLPEESVYNNKTNKPLVGHKMRLAELFFEKIENSDNIEYLDKEYYLSNILEKCVDQIFYIGYKEEIDKISDFYNKRDKILFIWSLLNIGFKQHLELLDSTIRKLYPNLTESQILDMVIDVIYSSKLRPKISKFYSKYISHRGRLLSRIDKNPILTLTKLIKKKSLILTELLFKCKECISS